MSFIAGRPLPVDSPSLPSCIRFNVSLQARRQKWRHVPYRDAAIVDTELWLAVTPTGIHASPGTRERFSISRLLTSRARLHAMVTQSLAHQIKSKFTLTIMTIIGVRIPIAIMMYGYGDLALAQRNAAQANVDAHEALRIKKKTSAAMNACVLRPGRDTRPSRIPRIMLTSAIASDA